MAEPSETAVARDTRARGPGLGIALMVLAVASLTLTDVTVKWVIASIPVGQVLFIRAAVVIVVLLGWMALKGRRAVFSARDLGGQLLCGVLLIATMFLFTYSLPYLALADAILLVYSAPLFVTALATPLLGEAVGWRRWSAVLVGFLGVAVVMRPAGTTFQLAALMPFTAAVTLALRDIQIRRMASEIPTLTVVLLSGLLILLASLATWPFGWVRPSPAELSLVGLGSLFFLAGQILMVAALRRAEAAVVTPFKYSAIVWAGLFGALLWGDLPDRWDLTGAGLIIASGLYILHRERVGRNPAI